MNPVCSYSSRANRPFVMQRWIGLDQLCADKNTKFPLLYLTSVSNRTISPDAVVHHSDRKQAVLPAFLSRILFNLNIGSGFGQSIHSSSCNLKWRLKSNPMHVLQHFVFREASASCFSRRFKKLLREQVLNILEFYL